MSQDERRKRHERRVRAREDRKKSARLMGLQYFLEMVDQKHRYGSSLRKYHKYWLSQDTNENFFHWLDHGAGLQVSLPECSRARLDKEQVRYLSREQRLQYLVHVNKDGLLVWAKNGEKVWTKDALYRDSIEGIVPISDPAPKYQYNVAPEKTDSSSALSNEEDSEKEDERPIADDDSAKHPKKHKWIFVSYSKSKWQKWLTLVSKRLQVWHSLSIGIHRTTFLTQIFQTPPSAFTLDTNNLGHFNIRLSCTVRGSRQLGR